MRNTEGSAIRRIGYNQWLRNIAVGLGNGGRTPEILNALRKKLNHKSIMVREHVRWAIKQHLKNIKLQRKTNIINQPNLPEFYSCN